MKTPNVLTVLTQKILLQNFVRAKNCEKPLNFHAWGRGTFWSFYWAWRMNPPGLQACGCVMEYNTRRQRESLRQATAAVSPVIGVILMVAITVVLAAIVFVLVSELSANQTDSAPRLGFQANATALMVVNAPLGLDWSEFTIAGCGGIPTGSVDAGDEITGCVERVTITHKPSNSVVYSR